ncbi:glycoside hydrolase family 2 protein [Trichococcus ilyis]|uniref:Beta-galactosidase n=1 Tax=Trichococcus ilyis TaxID=640938 RepID=A0A143YQH6_9LACT|nr:glycoside hydrolase family 2 TIM barrel-domain containing protein [Trichococcus ilyis]CZQ96546.1 Hypothetical protein TR210_1398 [Trichococcus ilyis]SEJ52040.1 beta-galactosidase [Trichococcus ilyis]
MRQIKLFNQNWFFTKENETTAVELPHTWNHLDGQDGGNDYYRGVCRYRKTFDRGVLDPQAEDIYLEFRGVNSSARVIVNGKSAAVHHGGYSTFRVNITELLEDENELIVEVDNRKNDYVYPQKADFTFYGGIYRDVYLIAVPKSHFDLDSHGGPGIMVTPNLNEALDQATVRVEADVTGNADSVRFAIAGVAEEVVEVKHGKAEAALFIEAVRLWDGVKDPHLYHLTATLLKDGEEIDQVATAFGCRSFHFDPEKGFYLNGNSYPLRGVARHQDWQGVGNAITKEMQETDMALIAEMGANTIRLAHYQHDQYFYDLCDQHGMIVWAEIPYISEHLPKGRANTLSQLSELIVQNYNHPSIITWGLSNEITVSGKSEDLVDNHQALNDLAHTLDATRPTTMAHVIMLEIEDPILEIPDIQSYNLYFGWYFGSLEDNEKWFDDFHKQHPEKAIGLAEYGADASIKWQTPTPERGDYTEQFQCVYHEYLLKTIEERPYIWATHAWNMFDFAADGREEGGEKGLNQKGLVTFDRQTKKDAFYLYKAYLSAEPFVHITGRRYIDRTEALSEVKVYSNQTKVALYSNGELIAEKTGQHVFTFEVPLAGEHRLEARSGDLVDAIAIRKSAQANPDYTLPSTGIHNWFDEPGMAFPEGKLSIKETLGTIRKTQSGAALVNSIIAHASSKRGDVAQGLDRNEAMERMMNGMTLEELLKQAGEAVPKEMIVQVNQELNKIEKIS